MIENHVHVHDEGNKLLEKTEEIFMKKSTGNDNNVKTGVEELINDSDYHCGLSCWKPQWLQPFASKQTFLVVFCITWVLQGMYYTYFVSVITTIEKLFQIQSKTTGVIMSATEIGQIGSSLLLTYYGGQGHRPQWIAWSMVLFAISSFTCSLPHFIYGHQLIHANDLLFTGVPSTFSNSDKNFDAYNNSDPLLANICRNVVNGTYDNMCLKPESQNHVQMHQIHKKITHVVLTMFFISLLGVGMGQTAVYTLGIPFIDDNVASRESPLNSYFMKIFDFFVAITIGVRILGPAMGFILGSFCTRLYADLSIDPQISPNDPRWVGAWWLGLVIVSPLLMLASIAMFCFPKQLNNPHTLPKKLNTKSTSLKDFPKTVKRLLNNDILMFRTASSVLHILPIAGFYTFLPKYLESQFRLAAHTASMATGIGGILVMGIGIIVSGVFILRVKPNAKFVAGWIAFTAFVYALGMGILSFIGCPMDNFAGLSNSNNGPIFAPTCNATCNCNKEQFSPICGNDGKTYYSACHAGCLNVTITDGKVIDFYNCQCMSTLPEVEKNRRQGAATVGYCQFECLNAIWYIGLFSFFVFIHSTSEVGSMLLILRCVDPRDKAMALGLIQFAIGLFGNVPCPIIYGAIVDSACLVWEKTCGQKGACWLYDSNVFRTFFHGITGLIFVCAFFIDVIVWYKAHNIKFVEESTEIDTKNLPELNELMPIDEKKPSVT